MANILLYIQQFEVHLAIFYTWNFMTLDILTNYIDIHMYYKDYS